MYILVCTTSQLLDFYILRNLNFVSFFNYYIRVLGKGEHIFSFSEGFYCRKRNWYKYFR